MNWYLAKLVFQIVCEKGNHVAQFDEQLRLIAAENIDTAYRKAYSIGSGEEESFLNAKEQVVSWRFIDVSELNLLHELNDGTELYSRTEEQANAEAYIHSIHQKARTLLLGNPKAVLNLV